MNKSGPGPKRGGSSHDEDNKKLAQKAEEYVQRLKDEKDAVDAECAPNVMKLIDQEIQKTLETGRLASDTKFVDIVKEKPIRVSIKVIVPVKEFPKINFVGKLMGPKGSTMKRLQEETMCKMAVQGKGCIKDKSKEEEFRQSGDPKYAHLNDPLHIDIVALAPPAEAHARIAFALAEVRKYLSPDAPDPMGPEHLEMDFMSGMEERRMPPPPRPPMARPPPPPMMRPQPPPLRAPPVSRPILPPPMARPGPGAGRGVSTKTKVFSILDRARVAMENQGYGYGAGGPPAKPQRPEFDYEGPSASMGRYASDDQYGQHEIEDMYGQPSKYSAYEYDEEPSAHSSRDYYEQQDYPQSRPMKFSTDDSNKRPWKSYKTTTTVPTSVRYRSAPYARPT